MPADSDCVAMLLDHDRGVCVPQPFPHLVCAEGLPPDEYEGLAQTFPALEIFHPQARGLDNRVLRIASSRVLSEDAFSSAWKIFVGHHTSQDFWTRIAAGFGERMRSLHPQLEDRCGKPLRDWRATRRGSGERGEVTLECQLVVNTPVSARASSVRGAHVDRENKLWSGLFYMRRADDASLGGELRFHRASSGRRFAGCETALSGIDPAATLPYRANTLVGFVNGPASVHSVSPRMPTARERRYVNLIAEIDHSIFELPQMNPLRRKWFHLMQWERSR